MAGRGAGNVFLAAADRKQKIKNQNIPTTRNGELM
jgi:hypothetical protein